MELSWGVATCFVYKKHSYPSPFCANDMQKGLYINGEKNIAEDVLAGNVELLEGRYMVGVQAEAKEALLKEMLETYTWSPETVLSSMPMFVGKLDPDKLMFLMEKEEVMFIEADGELKIPEPKQE